jgi:hypothetical protein
VKVFGPRRGGLEVTDASVPWIRCRAGWRVGGPLCPTGVYLRLEATLTAMVDAVETGLQGADDRAELA